MLGGRSWNERIAQYASSHQHPVNRFCHTLGIPLIVISIAWFAIAWLASASLAVAIALFAVGWTLQFVGHAFEQKMPSSSTTGGSCSSGFGGGLRRSAGAPEAHAYA